MKLVFALMISLFTFSALATCNPEAQFAGTVTKVKYYPPTGRSAEHFTFQLKLGNWFEPNIMCPLSETELEEAVIKLAGFPDIFEGDSISGVLVFDVNTKTYRIE